MARSYMCGFELEHTGEAFLSTGAGVSIQSSVVRGGSFAFRAQLSAAQTSLLEFRSRPAGGTLRSIFRSCRLFVQIATMPTVNTRIWDLFDEVGIAVKDRLLLNTDGTLTIQDSAGANGVTSTNALTVDGLWHRIEIDIGWSSGNGRRVFVDGVSWASSTTTAATGQTGSQIGAATSSNATADIYFDDVLWDDDTFVNSGFPGDSKQLILNVTSDNNRGTWTAGAGGTTNIWLGVGAIPPRGLSAAAETDTSQIKNLTNTANQDAVFNASVYNSAGIKAQDKINAVMPIWNDAEEVATGTKTGNVWISANPAQSAAPSQGSFDFGDDGGACGTFPSGWATHCGLVTVNPSVTVTTTPTVTIRAVSATTRARDCDFLGIYVDYTPMGGETSPVPQMNHFTPQIVSV